MPRSTAADGELRRELPRSLLPRRREPERDVRGVVAVLGLGGALELDLGAGDLAERDGQRRDGILGRHGRPS